MAVHGLDHHVDIRPSAQKDDLIHCHGYGTLVKNDRPSRLQIVWIALRP